MIFRRILHKITPIALFFVLVGTGGCSERKVRYRIGVSQCSSDDWRNQMNFELRREASFHDGVEVEILSADDDNEKQKTQITSLVNKGIDLLIVSPNEAGPITETVGQVFRKGIPVIVVDRKILSEDYSAYVGADNDRIGRNVARYTISTLGGTGSAIELRGLQGSSAAMERHQGFVSELEKTSMIKIVASVDAGWKTARARRLTDSLLNVYPNTRMIFAQNDAMGRGAYQAVYARGLTGRIKIVGVDALAGHNNGIEMVADGKLNATFIYPTGGAKVLQTAMEILAGKSFSRHSILQTSLITPENVELVKLQQLRINDLDGTIEHLNDRVGLSLKAISDKNTVILVVIVLLLVALLLLVLFLRAFIMKKQMNGELLQQQELLSLQNQQLTQQRDKLLELSSKLEEMSQARLNFYTNVSHDLRTPITLICNPIERVLEDDSLTESQRALLSTVQKNGITLLKLLDQILDLRRLDEGISRLHTERVDLCKTMTVWNESFEVSARSVGVDFEFLYKKETDYTVEIDVEKVERIFFNLMSNALRFTSMGGKIRVELLRDETQVEFRVSNTGSYIPPKEQNAIFDRFYTAGSGQAGTGIGLSVVKAFTDMHSGSVSVSSHKKNGTVFSVVLPAISLRPNEKFGESESGMISGEATGKPMILIIDDNADIRNYLTDLLQQEYAIGQACDGEQGLKFALEMIPDLIISDVMMPRMDGVQMCRELKQHFATCHIPVILLTAKTLDSQRIEGYQCGADSYICKPFSSKLIVSRIRNLLAARVKIGNPFTFDASGYAGNAKDLELLTRIKEMVEARIDDPTLSAVQIGSELRMSRTQFYRKVCSIMEITPNDYIQSIRIEKAKHMLKNTSMSVAEICYSVGFSSPSYFTKCFREREGITPKEFSKK